MINNLKKKKLFLTISIIFFVIPIWARDVEIIVEDKDLSIPLEGALIRSWDGKEYTSNGDGKAAIEVPDDRAVSIRVSYPGYENGSIVIPVGGESFTLGLRLGSGIESRELVIEAQRPGTSETRSGRSVAVSEEALIRTAETSLIEDVMNSVKLLPGVGYAGFFNAMPSIRGGDPADLTAVMDGFYIERPYHWGGGFSIFDPKMVQSARMSHGVFSARYGHTISGLLEVSSRTPSPIEAELDLGISTSALSLNASLPLNGKGGVMIMGKATYWDPFVWAAKQVLGMADNDDLYKQIDAVNTAPYIRSGAITGNYRFTSNLEWHYSAFFGADGIGIWLLDDRHKDTRIETSTDMRFEWANYLGFINTGLIFNPVNTTVLKFSLGAGFNQSDITASNIESGRVWYSDDFKSKYGSLTNNDYYDIPSIPFASDLTNTTVNLQGRFDLDWDLGRGFIVAAGAHELYSRWTTGGNESFLYEELPGTFNPGTYIKSYPVEMTYDAKNSAFNSSLYSLLEYSSPNQRFGAELGLRGDHLYFMGEDFSDGFSLQTMPVFNPRLNFDFGLLRNHGVIDKLNLAIGTGLFSSMLTSSMFIEKRYGLEDFDMKQNRSWTSVAGISVDFSGGFVFNIEGYYKYVFDRAYTSAVLSPGGIEPIIAFDGEGRVWGFDLMLQKLESRYWDGWITYSFNHARYRDPKNVVNGLSIAGGEIDTGGEWYYPSFHRFHNLNVVLNFKPRREFNIAIRLGFASGAPIPKPGEKTSYPVQMVDENGNPQGEIIEKWMQESNGTKRTTPSIPLDIKFSFYRFNPNGKVQSEFYAGIENVLVLLYNSKGNTTFNSYTGENDSGPFADAYELPIPMLSIGYKWSY